MQIPFCGESKVNNYFRLARFSLEKNVLEEFTEPFGIAVPANLLFYYKKSMAEFLKSNKRPFFIDPVTYLFTYPVNMLKTKDFDFEVDNAGLYKVKKSFEKLVKALDEDLITLFKTSGALQIDYFNRPGKLEAFAQNTLDFQKNLLNESAEPISRYETMLGIQADENSEIKPAFVIPPYFYYRNTDDPWYTISLRLSQLAKQLSPDDKVYSVICTEKYNLNEEFANKLITDYGHSDGFLLFISDFDETNETVENLKSFIEFTNRLFVGSNKPILNLYGSFFSMLLSFRGLEGVTSGLCILDHRDATAEFKGGIAALRFYLPSVKAKLAEQDFITFLQNFNTTGECDCAFCLKVAKLRSSLPSPRNFATAIDHLFSEERGDLMTSAMEHYLHNRIKEAKIISERPLAEILLDMQNKRKEAAKYAPLINLSNSTERITRAMR
jgi:hypothetical protein